MLNFNQTYRPMTMSIDFGALLSDSMQKEFKNGLKGTYAWDYLMEEGFFKTKAEFDKVFKFFKTKEEAEQAIVNLKFTKKNKGVIITVRSAEDKKSRTNKFEDLTCTVGVEVLNIRDCQHHRTGYAPYLTLTDALGNKRYWVCNYDYDYYAAKEYTKETKIENFVSLTDLKGVPMFGKPLYDHIKKTKFKKLKKYSLKTAHEENLRRLKLIEKIPGIRTIFSEGKTIWSSDKLVVPAADQLVEPTLHLMSYMKPSDFNKLTADQRCSHAGISLEVNSGRVSDGMGEKLHVGDDKPFLFLACGWYRFTAPEADIIGLMNKPGEHFYNSKRESPKVAPFSDHPSWPDWTVEADFKLSEAEYYRLRHANDPGFVFVDRCMSFEEVSTILNKFDRETYEATWGNKEEWGRKSLGIK